MINYNFYYWGPFVTKMKIPEAGVKELLKHCKRKENFNSQLAGIIKEQYKFDHKVFMKCLEPFLMAYLDGAKKEWNIKNISNKIKITESWVNFMKKNEFNPPHVHPYDIGCVLYLKIPDNLKKENENYKGVSAGPGCIEFRYGEMNNKLFKTSQSFFPEVGDFYVFPAKLTHFVYPFESDGERISLSANFNIQ